MAISNTSAFAGSADGTWQIVTFFASSIGSAVPSCPEVSFKARGDVINIPRTTISKTSTYPFSPHEPFLHRPDIKLKFKYKRVNLHDKFRSVKGMRALTF